MGKAAFAEVARMIGRTIICDEGCWTDHILNRHPEMFGHLTDVAEAVREPDVITLDSGKARNRCFYKYNVGILPRSPHVKVIVTFRRLSRKGYVMTAFPVNRIKSSEAIIWQRTPQPNP